jgi:hypothetical protein
VVLAVITKCGDVEARAQRAWRGWLQPSAHTTVLVHEDDGDRRICSVRRFTFDRDRDLTRNDVDVDGPREPPSSPEFLPLVNVPVQLGDVPRVDAARPDWVPAIA